MPANTRQKSELEQQIDNFLEYLSVEKGPSPLTIRNYKHYVGRFSSWLSEKGIRLTISDINPEVVRQFRVYLSRLPGNRSEGTMSRKTQSYHVIALRSFLRYLIKN